MKTIDLFEYDKSLGVELLGGIDEAGRGPLCGPVVCACCIMPYNEIIDGINDSKKVTEKKREELFETIKNKAVAYSVSVISPEEIDRINILNATKKGMAECVENLSVKPDSVLIDAVKLDIPIATKSIIKGDATSYCIAAASILAKVTRDRIMREYDEKYPVYGFAQNKGYGTKQHIEAIKKYGICEIHRRTFVKNFI